MSTAHIQTEKYRADVSSDYLIRSYKYVCPYIYSTKFISQYDGKFMYTLGEVAEEINSPYLFSGKINDSYSTNKRTLDISKENSIIEVYSLPQDVMTNNSCVIQFLQLLLNY